MWAIIGPPANAIWWLLELRSPQKEFIRVEPPLTKLSGFAHASEYDLEMQQFLRNAQTQYSDSFYNQNTMSKNCFLPLKCKQAIGFDFL